LKINHAYKLFAGTIALLLVITGMASFYALKIQNDIIQNEEHRLHSLLLAYELFQSSEDLTRMACSYVSTGDPTYEEHYYTILAIRNGKCSRPVNYDETYWHLAGVGKGEPMPAGERVALQELMRREQFTDEEFALLKKSQANSDYLVNMEKQAFAAMKGLYEDAQGNYTVLRAPDPAYATHLLFSKEYADEKAMIMVPIQNFTKMIDKRTNAELLSFQFRLRRQILLTILLISITLLVVLFKTIHTFRSILYPVKRLLGKVSEIAAGHYDARCVVDSTNEIGELCVKFNDMASALQMDIIQRKQVEEQIRFTATHDMMTGLPVMKLAKDFLSMSIRRSRRNKNMTAVMFIDLDGFKAINDAFGHDGGDYVLQQVASRLLSCVRESDTVARVGGDEFLIIADEIHVAQNASNIANNIVHVVSRPIDINGNPAVVGASIGIALYPADSEELDQLIKKADEAMYRVKKAGKNGFCFANPPAT
jgi:diguanylate cyclase (GGDEF)-like protein